jgi:hypothetical protein
MKKTLILVLGVIFFALMPLFTACEGFCPDGPDPNDPNKPAEVVMDSLLFEIHINLPPNADEGEELVGAYFLVYNPAIYIPVDGPNENVYFNPGPARSVASVHYFKQVRTKEKIDSALIIPTIVRGKMFQSYNKSRYRMTDYKTIEDTIMLHRGVNVINLNLVFDSSWYAAV